MKNAPFSSILLIFSLICLSPNEAQNMKEVKPTKSEIELDTKNTIKNDDETDADTTGYEDELSLEDRMRISYYFDQDESTRSGLFDSPEFWEEVSSTWREEQRKLNPDWKIMEKNSEKVGDMVLKEIELLMKLSQRTEILMKLYDEVEDIYPGFNAADGALEKLKGILEMDIDEQIGIDQEIRDTIVLMASQAKKNVKALSQIRDKYQTLILDDKEGLGRIETIPVQLQEVLSLHDADFSQLGQIATTLKESFERMKEDCNIHIKLESKFLKILWKFLEESKKLIDLGETLWIINSQPDYEMIKQAKSLDISNKESSKLKSPEQVHEQEDFEEQSRFLKASREFLSSYKKFRDKEDIKANKTKIYTKDEL